ncbi:MAG: LCP family protein [Elusimicrobiota bacterium]
MNQTKHLRAQRLFGLLSLILIAISILGAHQSSVAQRLNKGERVPVVLFGIDAADFSRHTDTLMISVLDPVNNYLNVLSVPRDTRIDLPGYKFRRVNEIYGYQFRKTKDSHASARMVNESLEKILAAPNDQIHLPYYLQVDFSGFKKVVDLLGGIWVQVKHPMHYDDNAGNYHFHKEPGRYLMKGNDALLYVRFRGHTGDRGRIYRQQEFVRNMTKRLANPYMILRIPEIVMAIISGIKTNMGFWDFIYFASQTRRIRSHDIGFYILPGAPSGPYWKMKEESTQLLSSLISGKTIFQQDLMEPIAPQADRITIKVWNASGKTGMGYKITTYLRKAGYDVIDWANAPTDQIQTRIIDRIGLISNAQVVAGTLGVENYHSEPNPKKLVDVEVVIGQNYTTPASQ